MAAFRQPIKLEWPSVGCHKHLLVKGIAYVAWRKPSNSPEIKSITNCTLGR